MVFSFNLFWVERMEFLPVLGSPTGRWYGAFVSEFHRKGYWLTPLWRHFNVKRLGVMAVGRVVCKYFPVLRTM
jgi:hypothetical protein